MFNVLLSIQDKARAEEVRRRLGREGLACPIAADGKGVAKALANESADLIILETDNLKAELIAWEPALKDRRLKPPPLLAVVPRVGLNGLAAETAVDDFLVKPYDIEELVTRVHRVLRRAKGLSLSETIRAGDLVIDLAHCEVRAGGRPVELAFREYELLKFLAAHPGRVFTRDALLNKVWGYDYFGGDRTVDVHIRRLRSKIEDAEHTYIDTVRNIGYRFRRDS